MGLKPEHREARFGYTMSVIERFYIRKNRPFV
jgi:hypothetical protein